MTNLRSLIAAACLKPLLHLSKELKTGLALLCVLLGLVISSAAQSEVIWVEDATPAGATIYGTNEGWTWITANPTPFSGKAHQSKLVTGVHQHYFYGAPAANQLSVNAGDTLFAYVYLDPANPPSEVMLQWNDGSWDHRAYWGSNNITGGVDGTASRRYMGPLPAAGQWVRLEVPASVVGLEGRSLNGMAFSLYNGRATWDRAGKASAGAGNVAPTVNLSTPANGSTHVSGQALVITANAADSDGSIASVAFYANGALLYTATDTPYQLTTSLAAGSYSLTAIATDNQGATTTSTPVNITVTPAPNVAPTASMTSPADGSSYTAPANITLSANAADSDGTITAVEFYSGATLIGSVTTPPYTATWSNVPLGNYSVRARAVDNQGAATYSNTIAVNVNAVVASGVYYLYADHLNTPRVITDTSNKVVWRWDSDPFGADAAKEDPDGDGARFRYNPRFPGQYFDRETGLHYNYFRDYEPTSGRYVQSDPIGLEGGLNTYGYVGSNPLSFIDPAGLQAGAGAFPGAGPVPSPAAHPVFQRGTPANDAFVSSTTQILNAVSNAMHNAVDAVKEMCQTNTCPACTPYPVGTIGYQGPEVGVKGRDAGTPHYNLYQVEQIPSTCKCIWKEKTKALSGNHHYYHQPNPAMGVNLNGSSRPPNYPR